MKRVLSEDKDAGITTYWHSTENGFAVETVQHDVTPILKSNAIKRGLGRDYYATDPDMWKAASIPIGVMYEWLTKYGVDVLNEDHWPAVKKLLNDPEWRYLKTAEIII